MLTAGVTRGQVSDAEKRRLFIEAREQIQPVKKPTPSPTPRPKPKPAAPTSSKSKPKAKSSPTPRRSPAPVEKATPKPTPEESQNLKSGEQSQLDASPKEKPEKQDSSDYILIPGEESPSLQTLPTPVPPMIAIGIAKSSPSIFRALL
jgi:outer membrane biosynthesis protein TonB